MIPLTQNEAKILDALTFKGGWVAFGDLMRPTPGLNEPAADLEEALKSLIQHGFATTEGDGFYRATPAGFSRWPLHR